MSEKHIPHHDQKEIKNHIIDNSHHERIHKNNSEQAEKARHEKSKENLHKIQELAKQEAEKSKKITTETESKYNSDSLIGMQSSMKTNAYNHILNATQRKLNKPARAFSKFTHSPTVDKISNISSQTIARPSGFLGGSICAFLGSSLLYYFSKHYGFKYNYLLVFLFFIGGYLVGALLELLIWVIHTRKQRY